MPFAVINSAASGGETPHFHVWRTDSVMSDSYWVFAASPGEAGTLIALNIDEAKAAKDADKFACEPPQKKMPAANLIFCRMTGPLAIERR
jgi:hypothetical protein